MTEIDFFKIFQEQFVGTILKLIFCLEFITGVEQLAIFFNDMDFYTIETCWIVLEQNFTFPLNRQDIWPEHLAAGLSGIRPKLHIRYITTNYYDKRREVIDVSKSL